MRTCATFLALCLLPGVAAFGKDPYGLMFTTPAQRELLDNRFNAKPDAEAGTAAVADAHASPLLKLNGTLISNTGRKEVWINGRRQLSRASGSAGNVQVLAPDRVKVRPTPSTPSRPMKPGQVMDLATGQISEAYTAAPAPQGR